MKTTTNTLPDDQQTLQQMVLQMQAKLVQKETLILTLQQALLGLRHRQFDRSSEQVATIRNYRLLPIKVKFSK
ncbi:hypothetical protein CA267_011205 [Alteromonas pelagimontana]|uniref:Uncharacterized protein n=1 Tax=Alteromonas pelagimontana TaxID=1858656 RepID=A0A6M4MDN9_9ALTE|nr:hypothetical protein [Alteromonas pelagimontana]QJR81304.1 hypothetical protein CA267_011205 [Alteromonas pelagimontana]